MGACYNTDKLYLLEIMVGRLFIDYKKLYMTDDVLDSLRQIIVHCQFQDFPEIQIREEEFCKVNDKYEKTNEVLLRTGKSCLFSAHNMVENLDYFTIKAKVSREKRNGQLVMLGSTSVQLDCHFVEILKQNSARTSRTLEETYPLYDKNCYCIGNISLCVRLSSLGKMILTSVQGGKGNEPFVVKGEGVPIDIGGFGDFGKWSRDGNEIDDTYGRLLGGMDTPAEGYPHCLDMQGMMHYGGGMMPGNMPYMQPTMGAQPTMGMETQQMGGSQRKGLQDSPFCGHVSVCPSSSSSEEYEPPPPPQPWPSDMFCSCDYPLPPGFEAPPPPPPRKKKKKKKKPEVECPFELKGDYCLKPNCPMGLRNLPMFPPRDKNNKETCAQFPMDPGSIGISNKQMMFQFQQQQNALDLPGPKQVTLQDDKNDIYILKIGSKHPDKKPKFILELKTPKLKIEDIRTQESDTQYRESDFTLPVPPKPPKPAKKDKKKGKKGKGKKK